MLPALVILYSSLSLLASSSGFLSAEPFLQEQIIPRSRLRKTELPIAKKQARSRRVVYERRASASQVGLGDYLDVTYSVLVDIGGIQLPLVLDTGSADVWMLSQQASIPSSVPSFAESAFQAVGLAVSLLYGDSHTGTQAEGSIGYDSARIAELPLSSQYCALVSDTNTSVIRTESSGILGLGFPLNSVIWNTLLSARYSPQRPLVDAGHKLSQRGRNLATAIFPDLTLIAPTSKGVVDSTGSLAAGVRRSSPIPTVEEVLDSFLSYGPPVARLAALGLLEAPMFSVALQRDTFEIGGNTGALTLGSLPYGISESEMTWVNIRAYSPAQGGLAAPASSPQELYPLAWEISIDDVYFDGEKLPRSSLSSSALILTALVDTGSSLVRGPQDVLDVISVRLGGKTYPCADPHSLAFSIGGRLFPIDPRDFGSQTYDDTPTICTPNLSPADPPSGGFLHAWSLGDPFLKGVLAAFYYGNLTYPSRDPPRVGFLSTVSPDADEHLAKAVNDASAAHMMLPAIMESPPTGRPNFSGTDTQGVAQASGKALSGATVVPPRPQHLSSALLAVLIVGSLVV